MVSEKKKLTCPACGGNLTPQRMTTEWQELSKVVDTSFQDWFLQSDIPLGKCDNVDCRVGSVTVRPKRQFRPVGMIIERVGESLR